MWNKSIGIGKYLSKLYKCYNRTNFGHPFNKISRNYTINANNELMIIQNESYELYQPPNKDTKLFITCEHATNIFPVPWKEIPPLMNTHWAYDLGAYDLTTSLSRKLDVPYISTRFSRLIIDANRPLDSPTLIRTKADNIEIPMNMNIHPDDLQMRINRLWVPYRRTFDSIIQEYPNIEIVLSIHSFTPVYEGEKRDCEVGVLCIENGSMLASQLCKAFIDFGYKAVINAPWNGSICDIIDYAKKALKIGIVLEFRQDLLVQLDWRERLIYHITQILESLGIIEPELVPVRVQNPIQQQHMYIDKFH